MLGLFQQGLNRLVAEIEILEQQVSLVHQQERRSIGVESLLLHHVHDTRQRIVGNCDFSAGMGVEILPDLSVSRLAIDAQHFDVIFSVSDLILHQFDGGHGNNGWF